MYHKLPPEKQPKVREMFKDLHYQLVCPAVIEGLMPGEVYVDDPDTPTSAMIIAKSWVYLAGEAHNKSFNQAIEKAITQKEIVSPETEMLFMSVTSDWEGEALNSLFPEIEPIPITRRFYTASQMDYDWQAQVPDGFSIEPIEASLLEKEGLEVPGAVRDLIESWERIPDPALHGVGFIAWHDGQIAAYAAVDMIVGKTGDIGLVTMPEFRMRGLATITAAAAIQEALTKVETVIWDCGKSNFGSVRTAEKLGLDFKEAHTMVLVDYDPYWHGIALANSQLDAGDCQKTVETIKALLAETEDPPPYPIFIQATAYAGMRDKEKAFALADQAIEKGWSAIGFTSSRPEWKPYHDTPEWESILRRVRKG